MDVIFDYQKVSPSRVIGACIEPRQITSIDSKNYFTAFGKGTFNKKQSKWAPASKPYKIVDIAWMGQYIRCGCAKLATDELRSLIATAEKPEIRDFKAKEFETVAVAGTFDYRNAASLRSRSRYIVLDIDNLLSMGEACELRNTLVEDEIVETALCFVSPSGLGVKWVVELPEWCKDLDFQQQYFSLSSHLGFQYGIQADPACSDVCRLCYLPYDPDCFINPKYQIYHE